MPRTLSLAPLTALPYAPPELVQLAADAGCAARIVAAADRPNTGVLIDALHFARSSSTLADVAALPRSRLHYAQICDGKVPGPTSVEGLIHDARCECLLPGEGGIELAALFAALPADLPIGIEIPNDTRASLLGHPAWVRRAVAATVRLLEAADAGMA